MLFSANSFPDVFNLSYCDYVISGKNNFGCVSLKRKKYCILNKEYSKEEYEKLKEEIITDMKLNPYVDKLGRKFFYGEFFPSEMSLFPYNKSNAMRFFQKTNLEKVIECANCSRAYKIVQGELGLLQKMGLPVPHECPKCRENKRFSRMTKPGMHYRDCGQCGKNIYTPYTPDDPRIVYCVKCYQQEFS